MAAMGAGGLPVPRLDQAHRLSPDRLIAPGGAAGTFKGKLVIVFGPAGAVVGVFVYQPGTQPGLGNPPVEWMTESTTDPFGNVVLPGTGTRSTLTGFQSVMRAGALNFIGNLLAAPNVPSGLYSQESDNAGSALDLTSGKGTGAAQAVTMTMLDTLLGFGGNAQVVLGQLSSPIAPGTPALLEVQGTIDATAVNAIKAGAEETFQSMATRGYQNGWTDSGNNPPGQFRLIAAPPGQVQIIGSLFTPANPPDGQVVINLPLVYHPSALFNNFTGRCVVPGNAGVQVRFNILANGNLTVVGAAALAANTEIVIPGLAGYLL